MWCRRVVCALLGAIAVPAVAGAQPVSGVYYGAGLGLNLADRYAENLISPADAAALGVGRDITVDFAPGFAGLLNLGYGFGNGLRVEVEGNVRHNEADRISVLGFRPEVRGYQNSWGFMANTVFDVDLSAAGVTGVTPYVGGGLGYLWTRWNGVGISAPGVGALNVNDTAGQFAYQAIVGAAFPVAIIPGLAVTAEYRYLSTFEPNKLTLVLRESNGTPVASDSASVDSRNHSVLLGFRYAFGRPATAPVAAPAMAAIAPAAAPTPARTFIVFFDFDRADLSERARGIIAEAAQNAGRAGTTRIEVAGHADRSGTPQYNQTLSERRAAAVGAELERRGVPRSAIFVQAFGESRPLVQTADGAREPQNRRVEILLR